MKLYINEGSRVNLEAIMAAKPHALLLTGKKGIGLATIAHDMASRSATTVVTVLPEKDEKIDLEKGMITVESIRRLYDLTKTIEPRGRTIIIDYAERMGIPAQNAFLKLLEEPTEGTQFILLTHTPTTLLPTIRSRTQLLELRPISLKQSTDLLDALKVHDTTKRTQLLFIAEGLPAELIRLAQNDTYFTERAQVVKDARAFVTSTPYARLLIAKHYKDTRPKALLLLEDAMKQLQQTVMKNDDVAAIRALGKLEQTHRRIYEQGNVRLQLSALSVL